MPKLIVGCGYLGGRVARRWWAAGHAVFAVTRTEQQAGQLQQEGLRPIVADVTDRASLAGLPEAETVLYAVGYDPRGTASRREVYAGGLQVVLDALPREPERILLISSTGVYGPAGGRWVDEDTPCGPTRDGGRAMLEAEEVLRGHRFAGRGIILRLAGLYGPGRLPRLAELRAGLPLAVPARGDLNLIHVDDVAAVVTAAEARAPVPRTYVVSDGHPVRRRAFYEQIAELLGVPRPQFVEPPPDAPNARHAAGDKRIKNARMLQELGVTLAYPTYREGLARILEPRSGDSQ